MISSGCVVRGTCHSCSSVDMRGSVVVVQFFVSVVCVGNLCVC